ncbi:hypothetical protein CcaCcLH18_02019 [Colletotrichum camelliae]|nr:hypothetical protein CcaCcLH18_02019 [Colletotrichum camelliae]
MQRMTPSSETRACLVSGDFGFQYLHSVNWAKNETAIIAEISRDEKPHQHTFNMPFFYSKPIGGKNFGTSVHADRHGIRRGPWRFRIGRFNCFR